MSYYRIAEMNVMMHGEEQFPYLQQRFSDYVCDPFDRADTVITLEDVDFIPVPEQKPVARSFMLRRFYKDSDSYDIYIVENEGDGACSHIHSNLMWSEITVKTSSSHITGIEVDFYVYRILWDAFINIIAHNGGIIIHSSAISYKGQGILFSAPSGTGKSTHTQLWKKLYPDSVELVNDDTPAVFFKGGKPFMYGIPYSGKGDNKNIAVPLKAVVFLERNEQNVISISDVDSSIFKLLEGTLKSVFIENMDITLKRIEDMLGCTDIYILGANMEDEAVETVRRTVFDE